MGKGVKIGIDGVDVDLQQPGDERGGVSGGQQE
jgi:hypothetical protein